MPWGVEKVLDKLMQKILTELILNELNLSIFAIFCTLQTFVLFWKGKGMLFFHDKLISSSSNWILALNNSSQQSITKICHKNPSQKSVTKISQRAQKNPKIPKNSYRAPERTLQSRTGQVQGQNRDGFAVETNALKLRSYCPTQYI